MAGRQGRFSRWFERIALGAIMSVAAFVVERRLLKVMRRRGEAEGEGEGAEAQGGEAGSATGAGLRSPAP